MKRLWAPWRIKYIKSSGKRQTKCLFCQSLLSKKRNYVFIKNKYSFALLNIYPYNNGHVMVAPNRHTEDITSLTDAEIIDLFKTLRQVINRLNDILRPQGYNMGMNIGKCSGAGIPEHLHLHIVPRWEADTNFMPVITNTKVISQSLDDLYRKLKSYAKSKSNQRIRR